MKSSELGDCAVDKKLENGAGSIGDLKVNGRIILELNRLETSDKTCCVGVAEAMSS